MTGVTVWEWDDRLGRRLPILTDLDWSVGAGEQWAVLGPNGAGKSTLLDVGAGMRHPSRGEVEILGETVGRVDLRVLRERIGHVDVKTEEAFSARMTAWGVVLTGVTGTIQVLEDRLGTDDRERAAQLLEQFGCAAVADHAFASCSQGERRRILLARALMRRPQLLLLDEPSGGLDLPGREALLAALAVLAGEQPAPAVVLVTHHLEELPPSITHALLLRDGSAVACGAAPAVLADEPLSACFGVPVRASRAGGRWAARATPSW
ncbi:MAG: ATP-binding cassette domain-containing protein [Actinobacteria bacterium]|nr:ATP-binding cassette domain-containing protein [Actinomycetota bacterium]